MAMSRPWGSACREDKNKQRLNESEVKKEDSKKLALGCSDAGPLWPLTLTCSIGILFHQHSQACSSEVSQRENTDMVAGPPAVSMDTE